MIKYLHFKLQILERGNTKNGIIKGGIRGKSVGTTVLAPIPYIILITYFTISSNLNVPFSLANSVN